MKALKSTVLLILGGIILFSCSDPRSEEIEKIAQMENALFSEENSMGNMDKADELINQYSLFADQFPEDSLAPEYLFKAADIAMNINKGEMAINIYNRILKSYPDFRKAPECLFLKAYVYENNLGQLNKARYYYQEFIDKYPDNDFADDAEISIQNLGKSPEELIKEFEEKMKAQEDVQ
jgi:outer membrane protein assembly factor BamD (BamD/ComL family)